jgi:hypothetical protein
MTPDTVPLDRLDELWDVGDPAASERRFLALRPRAEREEGGAHLAELLTQVARAPGLHVASTTSRPRSPKRGRACRSDARGRIRLLLEHGRVANTAGGDGRGAAEFRDALP